MGKKHKSKKHHRKGTDASEGNKIRTDEIWLRILIIV